MAEPIRDLEPPAPPQAAPRTRPWWSRLVVAVAALGIALVAATHLLMTFLVNSPQNTVSDKYAKQINEWIYPWFDQNWRLFAPNPLSENVTIETRVASDCGRTVSPWYDLTAIDDAAILHNPFPGHTEQNELRRAWLDGYLPSHGADDEPLGDRAEMLRQYLVNIALEKIKGLTPRDGLPGAQIAQIEFRVTTQVIAPPTTPNKPPKPDVRIVPWRQVSPQTISYGCVNGSLP